MSELKLVLSDFDGTITLKDELTSHFFKLLDLLKHHNLPLVIVTGRSLSWAHFLLTHFSYLEDVIAEGGGVRISRIDGRIEREDYIEFSHIKKLNEFAEKLVLKFPQISLSADSYGRLTDRAIELKDLESDKSLESNKSLESKITHFMDSESITYSKSNVHLNFWSGEISKARAVTRFLKEKNIKKENVIYFGDSLNDESLFKELEKTVGVSNIKSVLDQLKYRPQKVLTGSENEGPKGIIRYLKNTL